MLASPRKLTPFVQNLFRLVTIASVIAAIFQISLGGIVRVTESGLGCPDWPLCHGQIIPPLNFTTLIEYSHRLSASLLTFLVLSQVVLSWKFYRPHNRVVSFNIIGLFLILMAAVLGGITVLTELAWWVVLIHLAVAETALACLTVSAFLTWTNLNDIDDSKRIALGGKIVKLTLFLTLIVVFGLILSGSYMVGYGAAASCGTWPLCRGALLPEGIPYAIHMAHRIVAAIAGLLIVGTAILTWINHKGYPELRRSIIALVLLFSIQVMMGALIVWTGFPSSAKALHLTLATLVWVNLVLVVTIFCSDQKSILRQS